MSIICEHVHRLELWKFKCWVASAESPISYSCISYFGHTCPKLNIVLISCLTDKMRSTKFKTYAILVYGRLAILWTNQ